MKLVKQNKAIVQFANRIAILAMKIGIAPKYQFVLSVQGRKSGRIYSTPVYIIEEKINRFLVSPYGEVTWVINARAAGKITLEKNNVKNEYRIVELSATQSAPILKKYLTLAPITQPYFDARPDSPVEMFFAEASRHPVFELIK